MKILQRVNFSWFSLLGPIFRHRRSQRVILIELDELKVVKISHFPG